METGAPIQNQLNSFTKLQTDIFSACRANASKSVCTGGRDRGIKPRENFLKTGV